MLKVLVWGTGSYYQKKKKNIQKKYNIVAYVDQNKMGQEIDGNEIIGVQQINNYEFDEIIVMSVKFQKEIVKKIIEEGISYNKIVLGINLLPYTMEELSYFDGESKFCINNRGDIEYYCKMGNLIINEEQDLEKVKDLNLNIENMDYVKKLTSKPVSKAFGYDRGYSIGRYYIDRFIEKNKKYIKGTVVEIGDRRYSDKFGSKNIESYCFKFQQEEEDKFDIVGDLSTGKGIIPDFADCFIVTQTLDFIFDLDSAIENIIKILKPNGSALITVSGISPISRTDMDDYGHFRCFTDLFLRKSFSKYINNKNIEIETFGNVKTSAAYLYGCPVKMIEKDELLYHDRDYQMVIGAVIKKGE